MPARRPGRACSPACTCCAGPTGSCREPTGRSQGEHRRPRAEGCLVSPGNALRQAWASRIWRRQAVVLTALVCAALGGFGAVEMAAWYRAVTSQVFAVQFAQAREAAQSVRGALSTIERHVTSVTLLPWSTGGW